MNHLVVFASGSGTNFQAIIDAVQAGRVPAGISGLIADRGEIGAIERAEKNNIPVRVLPPPASVEEEGYVRKLLDQLRRWEPDLIVLAGYLRRIPREVVSAYEGRIINIHPALLPRYGGEGYYGMRVHRAVIENGDAESGCTVHLVNEKYDEGPVIDREKVPVHPSDTPEDLAARVLEKEHELLPRVIRRMLQKPNSN